MAPLRRHPSRLELEAWFDGEAGDGLGWHISACRRCLAHVDTLSKVRAAVHATTVPARPVRPERPAPLDESVLACVAAAGAGATTAHSWRRASLRGHPFATAAAAAVVTLGAMAGLGEGPLRGALFADGSGTNGTASAGTVAHGPASPSGAPAGAATVRGAPAGPRPAATALPAGSGAPPAGAGAAAGTETAVPLRLAVIVPTTGPDAAEGSEVADAVQKAVAEADASGGVHGAPVQLTVVSAEDPSALAALAGRVDAVVGGFDATAPAGVPWLLPADPSSTNGDAVAAELSPRSAGALLAADLVRRGVTGTVGVIDGGGPDAALGTGIAQALPVRDVPAAAGSSCSPAVAALSAPGSGVDAVAVAGPPALAASCLSALAGPAADGSFRGGVLLAPSAAYADTPQASVVPGATTVLGLPWPTSSAPGAARFRSVAPGVTSYRAMVSFAATEMAVAVARATGLVTPAAMAGGSWRSDLVDYTGTANVGAQQVVAGPLGWVTAG